MESKDLITKADKAREAANMGRRLKGFGVSHEFASDAAHHELQHAINDSGPGRIGIDNDIKNLKVTPFYKATGTRTAEEELNYTQAATDNLSENDKKRIEELKEEIKQNKKGLLARIFGL